MQTNLTDIGRVNGRKQELARVIAGRMSVERAADLSDREIDRTLGPCVCGPMLIRVAKQLRAEGLLVCGCSTQPATPMEFCPICEKLRPSL